MTSKNIFFTSNSHSEIFPANTRRKFCSQIDQNKIDYIDKNNVTTAIKTITFENKFNALSNEYGKPSIIVIQQIVGEGAFLGLGMPNYGDRLTKNDIDDVKNFILSQAKSKREKGIK